MPKVFPELKSSPIIKRYENNPILSRHDIPYEATQIYNAGITKYEGKYVMVFRDDVRTAYGELGLKGIHLGLATSDDGIHWDVRNKPFISQQEAETDEIERFYDPRLTVIDGELYMCFAIDTKHGLRGGIGKIHDLEKLEILTMTVPDNRNMVLFPEKIGGYYARLERPMPIYSRGKDRFDMWYSTSPDLEFWGRSKLVMGVEHVKYANDKIGPAAPPVKTEKGWLTTFHAVDIDYTRGKNGWEDKWQKRYTAGIALLDLEDPSKVIGKYEEPLLAPETDYEVDEGLRQNVIFPGGMILEDSGEVKIYYGAADTVECLATADVNDLLKLCLEGK